MIIDTPFINKNLILVDSETKIASAIPKAWHYIKTITMPPGTERCSSNLARNLLLNFSNISKLQSSKIFLTDTVIHPHDPEATLRNVIIFINATTPSTYPFQKISQVFYTKGDKGFVLNPTQGPRNPQIIELKPSVAQRYLNLFHKQKNRLFLEHQEEQKEERKPVGLQQLLEPDEPVQQHITE